MDIALLVLSSPLHAQGSRTALNFARAAVAAGHQIPQVFFFAGGTCNGTAHSVQGSDETPMNAEWKAFAAENGTALDACISSAMKRGLLDSGEARRHDWSEATLADGFELAGLGQLATACLTADRVVTL